MSDVQTKTTMKFECLPNEIFIECFEYLNTFEIFYSFHRLNYRFNQLIQSISMHLNFQYVRKSIFEHLRSTITLNPDIKNQIHSLYLSDEDDCGQTELFLSFFSVTEFVNLKSLTLNNVNKHNMQKIKPMLPLLTELCSLYIIQAEYLKKYDIFDILVGFPMTKLQKLLLPSEQHLSRALNNKISSIKELTLSRCNLTSLSRLLEYIPMLEYLNIQRNGRRDKLADNISSHNNYNAIHLKQLIFMDSESDFEELELLLKQTRNLENLTISAMLDLETVDADGWEKLIRKYKLSDLNTFSFEFDLKYSQDRNSNEASAIIEKFKRFQSDFWQKEHHWYTEYTLDGLYPTIYSIPYMSKTYGLPPNINRNYDELTTNSTTFVNVTDLTLSYDSIKEKCHYYFSNVITLIINDYDNSSDFGNRI